MQTRYVLIISNGDAVMKVLGFTDEITTCDCCGKRNLKGSFAIETNAGEIVHYGSVCVGRAYGSKQAKQIKFAAEKIALAQKGSWADVIRRISLGHLGPFVGFIGDKPAWNNSDALMAQVTSIRHIQTGQIIRERAA